MSQKKKPIHEKILKMWNSCNKNENLMKEELHKSGLGFSEINYAIAYFTHSDPQSEDSDKIADILKEILAGSTPGNKTVVCKINE